MKPPDHFSVSQLRKYLGCPLAYRFKYLDRIETRERTSALVLGKAFHAAAELLHRHLMNGGVQRSKTYHDALAASLAEQSAEYDVLLKDGESPESLRDEGLRLFDLYLDYRTSQPGVPVAAEKRIACNLIHPRTGEGLGAPFVGYIDLVESDGNGRFIVVDLKTASKSCNQAAVDADIQLAAYALLLALETGSIPSRLRIVALVRNKTPKLQTIETTRTEDDMARFWSLARAVWATIQAGHFYPNPSWLCGTCEYADYCAEWGLHNGEEG